METKWICIMISIIAVAIATVNIASNLTKPVLIDPVAQRIWAATHGKSTATYEEATKLIREATFADSIKEHK